MKTKVPNFKERFAHATTGQLREFIRVAGAAHAALQKIEIGDINGHSRKDIASATYRFMHLLGVLPETVTVDGGAYKVEGYDLISDPAHAQFGVKFSIRDSQGSVRGTTSTGLIDRDDKSVIYPTVENVREVLGKAFPKAVVLKTHRIVSDGNGGYETVWNYTIRSKYMQPKKAGSPLVVGVANSVNEPVALMQAIVRLAHEALFSFYTNALGEENRNLKKMFRHGESYGMGKPTTENFYVAGKSLWEHRMSPEERLLNAIFSTPKKYEEAKARTAAMVHELVHGPKPGEPWKFFKPSDGLSGLIDGNRKKPEPVSTPVTPQRSLLSTPPDKADTINRMADDMVNELMAPYKGVKFGGMDIAKMMAVMSTQKKAYLAQVGDTAVANAVWGLISTKFVERLLKQ